eukprot:1156911-Pelagomonas_calceolata.AAC.2
MHTIANATEAVMTSEPPPTELCATAGSGRGASSRIMHTIAHVVQKPPCLLNPHPPSCAQRQAQGEVPAAASCILLRVLYRSRHAFSNPHSPGCAQWRAQ